MLAAEGCGAADLRSRSTAAITSSWRPSRYAAAQVFSRGSSHGLFVSARDRPASRSSRIVATIATTRRSATAEVLEIGDLLRARARHDLVSGHRDRDVIL